MEEEEEEVKEKFGICAYRNRGKGDKTCSGRGKKKRIEIMRDGKIYKSFSFLGKKKTEYYAYKRTHTHAFIRTHALI